MFPLQSLLGNLIGVLSLLFMVLGPVLLYIWLRSEGTLGDPPGRGLE